MPRTLIDGLWYFGGNRERGIGRYLDYYFRKVCDIPEEDRFWLIPQQGDDSLANELLQKYGGQSIELDLNLTGQRQREFLARWLDEKLILEAFIASPFERPRAMLDFVNLFQEAHIFTQGIVFDLLPLQHRQEILQSWPEEDQEQYERRIGRLRRVDALYAISEQTRHAVVQLADYPSQQIQVLEFGLSTRWLDPPPNWQKAQAYDRQGVKQVLTISGGEWRKNLPGTLAYFAQEWKGKKAKLTVVCRLSWQEWLRFTWQSVRLGIWRQVEFTGMISEEEKWKRLAATDVFLFLSRAEGLGIPLLEAKRAGVEKILISQELAEQGFGKLVGKYEVAKGR